MQKAISWALFPAISAQWGIISIFSFSSQGRITHPDKDLLVEAAYMPFLNRLSLSALVHFSVENVEETLESIFWCKPSVVCGSLAKWRTGETGPSVLPTTLPEPSLSLWALLILIGTQCCPFSQPFHQYYNVPPTFMQSNRWNMILSSAHNMIAYSIHKSSWIITDPISHSGTSTASTRQIIMDCLLL